jgi:hypothetical protein
VWERERERERERVEGTHSPAWSSVRSSSSSSNLSLDWMLRLSERKTFSPVHEEILLWMEVKNQDTLTEIRQSLPFIERERTWLKVTIKNRSRTSNKWSKNKPVLVSVEQWTVGETEDGLQQISLNHSWCDSEFKIKTSEQKPTVFSIHQERKKELKVTNENRTRTSKIPSKTNRFRIQFKVEKFAKKGRYLENYLRLFLFWMNVKTHNIWTQNWHSLKEKERLKIYNWNRIRRSIESLKISRFWIWLRG